MTGCGRKIGPYDCCTVVCGDCLELMKAIPDGAVDAVITDPPYGIDKAEWDGEFSTEWMADAERLAWKIAVMPGTWNLLSLPKRVGHLRYRWTLAAHLTNGMTRGRMGFGNWIPCVVYSVDYSHSDYRMKVLEWCRSFGDWCRSSHVKNADLDMLCGTSSMGDWWTGRSLPWVQLPKPEHWSRIRSILNPPSGFNILPESNEGDPDYSPSGDCRDFTIGIDDKPEHPCPKPLRVMEWIVSMIPGQTILDPFLGSGTTAVAAKKLGRHFLGFEISPEYCRIAEERIALVEMQPSLFEKRPKQVVMLFEVG